MHIIPRFPCKRKEKYGEGEIVDRATAECTVNSYPTVKLLSVKFRFVVPTNRVDSGQLTVDSFVIPCGDDFEI